MAHSLAERLAAARRRQFVGRADELALFRSALQAPELPFHLLYVYGPGGVGKTTVLREFVELSGQAGLPAYYVDARNVDPTPESFTALLRQAFGIQSGDTPIQFLASQPKRRVLLIDTYEALGPLDNWLRDVFFPELPDDTLVVVAGREPLGAAWKSDPGWQSLIHTIPLRNLSPEESRAYLLKRGIPIEQHQRILDFTHGHALALSLVADVLAQRGESRFEPGVEPDVIRMLLERFVQKVPGPAHRAALEACALVRVTTEGLLAQMMTPSGSEPASGDRLSVQAIHELFEWLRGLSFIESGREGLFPHDLARETLVADLRWRNPDWYKELHNRARVYYSSRIQSSPTLEQHRILFDYVYLHRDNPVARAMMDWQAAGGILPDSMRDADRESLVKMVARHEGDESARIAARWITSQPEGVTVYRDEPGHAQGFLAMVALDRAKAEELDSDPATRLAWEFLRRKAPLRAGETATYYRCWMALETYQDVSPVQTLIILNTVRHQLTTQGLAYHFLTCANPEFWAGPFTYANLARLTEVDFEVGGRRYGVYGHDWRAEPPLAWLALMAEREVSQAPAAPPPSVPPVLVLSQSEFVEAVQNGLRGLAQTGGLRGNPLLRSRLVVERAGASASDAEREAALASLFKEVIDSLSSAPRQVRLYRALYHTFIRPEATQERAAEILDLPFSTYRRHLKAGIEWVIQELWERELGGAQK